MPSHTVARFMERLLESESSNRPEPVAELFPADARLERPVSPGAGDQGPLEFWRRDLASFERLASEFTRITDGEGFASLEWVSRAVLVGGREVTYRGVTLLEIGPGGLTAMRTYYDTAPLLPALGQGVALSPLPTDG